MLCQISQQKIGSSSASPPTDLQKLAQGYSFFAKTEGKSFCTIAIVSSSVIYLERFLESEGLTTDVAHFGPSKIRAFILYLQQKRCFSDHRFTKPQEKGLSRHSINCYLRSIRSFWSWLISEGIVESSPFAKIKVPKAPRKIMPTFSNEQIGQLLGTISTPPHLKVTAIRPSSLPCSTPDSGYPS